MNTEIISLYRAKLRTMDDGTTGIHLVRVTDAVIKDKGGRRQYRKEMDRDVMPDEVLAELTMAQAAGLLASLADNVGWMAAEHPDCKVKGEDA